MKKRSMTTLAVATLALCASVTLGADRPEVGSTAPAISLVAADGQNHSLAELQGKKTAVVVFFRGLW
ncbi:MAG: hypothetical protein GY906_03415 [bacterium]|nr:hypothetical protein [bacterium]